MERPIRARSVFDEEFPGSEVVVYGEVLSADCSRESGVYELLEISPSKHLTYARDGHYFAVGCFKPGDVGYGLLGGRRRRSFLRGWRGNRYDLRLRWRGGCCRGFHEPKVKQRYERREEEDGDDGVDRLAWCEN